jgi:hypothetical protein
MPKANAHGWTLAVALVLGLTIAGAASAQSRWALGTQIGSTGIGGEVSFQASPHFTLRGDYDYFRFDGSVKGDVLTYKGHFHMSMGGLFGDWHPWASNGFLLTAGAYIGQREAGGGAGLESVSTIGGQTFTLDEVRGLKATAKLDQFAPTIGLGYNNTFLHNHWGFKAIAGVVFSDQPRAQLERVNGPVLDPATAARLQAAIQAEQAKIDDHLTILKTYPLIEIGVAYRF